MSWSEIKKLSDVIKSNVVPSEFVLISWNAGTTTVDGDGIALYSMTGDSRETASTTSITVDGERLDNNLYLLASNAYQTALIPFKKSLEVTRTSANTPQSTLSVFLFDREFIGGGTVS